MATAKRSADRGQVDPGVEAAANDPGVGEAKAGASPLDLNTQGTDQTIQVDSALAKVQAEGSSGPRTDIQRKRKKKTRPRSKVPAAPEQRIGEIVDGTYLIRRLLATGGMGAVYEVDHTRIQQQFAIKFLDPAIAKNTEVYARFRQEAEIAAKLNHNNVVQVFDFNTDPYGQPYMVMELVKGQTLDEMIKKGSAFNRDEIVAIFEPLCEALDACHKHGIVHRDLKPSNIIVNADLSSKTPAYTVKLLDFGISKIKQQEGADIMTRDNVVMGTPNYMSPEQARGDNKSIEGSTDIFALGAILYEMLSGRRAFDAEGLPQVLHKIVYSEPPPLKGTPAAVTKVVERCLSKAPEDRFASATDIVAELKKSFGSLVRSSSGGSSRGLRIGIVLAWIISLGIVAVATYSNKTIAPTVKARTNSPAVAPYVPPAPAAPVSRPAQSYDADLAGPEARLLEMDGRLYRADRTGISLWTDPGARPKTRILPSAAAVLSLGLSNDRRQILVGQADGSVSRWDLNLREKIWSSKTGNAPVQAVAVGSGYLATASDNTVRMSSLSTDKTLKSFKLSSPVRSLLLTRGNRTVLIAVTDEDIELIDADRRKSTLRLPVPGKPLAADFDTENGEENENGDKFFWVDFHQGNWTVRRKFRLHFPSLRKGPQIEHIGPESYR